MILSDSDYILQKMMCDVICVQILSSVAGLCSVDWSKHSTVHSTDWTDLTIGCCSSHRFDHKPAVPAVVSDRTQVSGTAVAAVDDTDFAAGIQSDSETDMDWRMEC